MTLLSRHLLIFVGLLSCASGLAKPVPVQRSGMVGNAIAEFIPAGFDPVKTPSLILQKEPVMKGTLPAGWDIVPEFTLNEGRAGAVVHLKGDISLYGGGEVTGPLLRNGQTIKLWNTDNGAYGTDEGKRLYQTHPWVMGVRKDGTAFGVIFDSSWKSELTTDPDKIELRTEGALF